MSEPIREDPIVAEVRSIRDSIVRKCNYDLRSLFEQIKVHEQASGRTFVSHPPQHIDPAEGAA